MSDDGQLSGWQLGALLTVAAAAGLILWFILFSGAVWPFAGNHDGVVTEEWCKQHDGELVNHMVVGHHGGLHCHLENGSTYHVDREREGPLEDVDVPGGSEG